MEFSSFLPEEIILDILSRVTTESVLDCKLVCKGWRDIVSHHPLFHPMHMHYLNHPFADSGKTGFIALTPSGSFKNGKLALQGLIWYFEYNENHDYQSTAPIESVRRINFTSPFENTDIVGSCNGLICLCSHRYEPTVCIINPITREYVVLPKPNSDPNMQCGNVVGLGFGTIGFGYVASTNEYKVVALYNVSHVSIELHIYTLGSVHGWRNLGEFNYKFDACELIFANGALHWMNHDDESDIISFDLAEEKFSAYILKPPFLRDRRWSMWYDNIGVLDGHLCFAVETEGLDYYYDIWLLRKKNDDHKKKEQPEGEGHQSMIWDKEFKIDLIKVKKYFTSNSRMFAKKKEYSRMFAKKKEYSRIFAITKTGGVLTYVENYLSIYDTRTSTSKMLIDFKDRFHKILPHNNTLVSLKELGEENTKIMESTDEDDKNLRLTGQAAIKGCGP